MSSVNSNVFFNDTLLTLKIKSPEEKSYSGKLYSKLNNLVNKANLTNNRFLNITLKTVVIFALIAPAIIAVVMTSFADGVVATKNGAINLKNKITKKPASRFEKVVNFVKAHKFTLAVGFGLIGSATLGYWYRNEVYKLVSRLFGQEVKLVTNPTEDAVEFVLKNNPMCSIQDQPVVNTATNSTVGTAANANSTEDAVEFVLKNNPMCSIQDQPVVNTATNSTVGTAANANSTEDAVEFVLKNNPMCSIQDQPVVNTATNSTVGTAANANSTEDAIEFVLKNNPMCSIQDQPVVNTATNSTVGAATNTNSTEDAIEFGPENKPMSDIQDRTVDDMSFDLEDESKTCSASGIRDSLSGIWDSLSGIWDSFKS